MKRLSVFLGILLMVSSLYAQDIFKQHGFDREMLTLSKGKYKEVFTNDEVIQIGTVLLNTRNSEVIKFLEEESSELSYKEEYSSRFLTMDPLAEKYPQLSPYAYCLNNPVRFVDPDGRTPAHIIAGFVGGVLDYGLQVTTNYIEGKSGTEAWTNVSGKSILISAGTSATGVGLATKVGQISKLVKMGKVATTAAKVAGEMAVDATMSTTNQLISEGSVDISNIAIDVAAGQIVGNTVGSKVKTDAQNSAPGKVLLREADRTQRVASGNAPRESRVKRAQEATKKAESYGDGRAAGAGTAASGVVSGTYELLDDEKLKNK